MLQFLIISNMKVSIDTRTIKKGEYFVPIKGPNFDGNKFINEALKKGAKGIIKEDDFYRIAKEKLTKINPFIIAVAGSIGKSTFRSYLYSILKTKFDVLESDLNTKLGFSLKVINELNNQKIIVAEIGIDRIGEMEKTSSFMKPDISIITKLGKEHLEFFKSLSNVIRENLIVVKNSKLKIVYLNIKDKNLCKKFFKKEMKIIYFPKSKLSEKIENKIDNLFLPDHEKDYLKAIYLIISERFMFTDSQFISALKKLIKPKGRLNILKGKNGCMVIDDTYNAVCDQTIIEGIKFASKIAKEKNKKLHLIISNMRENGSSKITQHKKVADYINNCQCIDTIIFGDETELYKKYIKRACVVYINVNQIKLVPSKNDLFYIKSANYYKGYMLVESLVNGI